MAAIAGLTRLSPMGYTCPTAVAACGPHPVRPPARPQSGASDGLYRETIRHLARRRRRIDRTHVPGRAADRDRRVDRGPPLSARLRLIPRRCPARPAPWVLFDHI